MLETDNQSPETTLLFIETAFKALAEDKGDLQFKGQTFRVGDVSAAEVRGLCNFSEKFFRREANLPVNGKLLCDIEKVKSNARFIHTDFKNFENTERLNALKEWIFLNQMPEVEKGARPDLQKPLCSEIKRNAWAIKRMRKMEKIKRWGVFTAMWLGILGIIVGFFALALSGFVGGGIALFIFGIIAAVGAATTWTESIKQNVKRAQWIQDGRMWAFELLKEQNAFFTLCQEGGLDPTTVTVNELLKTRR